MVSMLLLILSFCLLSLMFFIILASPIYVISAYINLKQEKQENNGDENEKK